VTASTDPQPSDTEPPGRKSIDTESPAAKPTATDPAGTAPASTEQAGTSPAGTASTGIDPAGSDPAGVDPAGIEQTGTDPAGTEDDTSLRSRRRPPAWLVGAGGVLVVIVAVALLRGGGDDSARAQDLSTPESAAEAFARAAAAGDVDGLLAVTCLGDAGCAAEHGGGASTEQITAAKRVLADNVREIGGRFGHAHFTAARAGSEPGTREVDYRLPGMPENERNYLVFVEHQDRWFYIATGSGAASTAPPVPTT